MNDGLRSQIFDPHTGFYVNLEIDLTQVHLFHCVSILKNLYWIDIGSFLSSENFGINFKSQSQNA